MDAGEAIQVSGLLRVVLREEEVRKSLAVRPDWVGHLHHRLVELRDPFASDVDFAVWWPSERGTASDEIPLVPRLGRISMTPLNLGGTEVHFENDTPMRFEGSQPVAMKTQEFLPQGIVDTVPYPIMPGDVALTLFVPPDASAEDWRDVTATAWARIGRIREAQRRAVRDATKARIRQLLDEARAEIKNHGEQARPDRAELIAALETRLGELEREPTRTRVRIDRPFRELVWLGQFLGEGTAPLDIATEWDERVATWSRGTASQTDNGPVLAAAREEWQRGGRHLGTPATDASTVERSLKRWLGEALGANPEVRPDPLAPGGYRWSGKVASRHR